LIAKRIGDAHSVIVATPEYIKKFGAPEKPEELREHNCLTHASVGKTEWSFKKNNEVISIPIKGNLSSNETTVLLAAVLNHAGVTMLPTFLAHTQIKERKLVCILQDWQAYSLGIYGVYVSKKYMPPVMRAFLDFITEEMKNAPWG